MPYEINWESCSVCVRYSGAVTAQDIKLASMEVAADPRMAGIDHVICDFLGAHEVAISQYEALLVAANNHDATEGVGPRPRVAIVTDSKDAMHLALTYAESPLMEENARVFPRLAEAKAWVLEKD
jgi:hypothetical protein